jgi:hypothetical protein
VYPSLCKCALRLVWPVNSHIAVLSLDLFMARSSLALLGKIYLISTLDYRYPVQAAHLSRCLCSNCFLMRFLPTLNGIAANWSGGTSTAPSLASLSASSLPGIPWCPGIHIKVTLLDLLTFSSTLHALPNQRWFSSSLRKCCYSCSAIKADVYSSPRKIFSQKQQLSCDILLSQVNIYYFILNFNFLH